MKESVIAQYSGSGIPPTVVRTPDGSPIPFPTFKDLRKNAGGRILGIPRRLATRYYLANNYERTKKLHTILGASVVRFGLMNTYGRLFPQGEGGRYRVDYGDYKIEASNKFAFNKSVKSEFIHTVGVLMYGLYCAAEWTQNGVNFDGWWAKTLAAATVVNLAAISLQRYNRARMAQRVNEELQRGQTFGGPYHYDYRSWTGIDDRAMVRYYRRKGASSASLKDAFGI